MRPYIEFIKRSFRKRMQYRAANLAGLTTNFFFAAVRILVFSAFYAHHDAPEPLSLQEVITYICLTQAFIMAIPAWGMPDVAQTIRTGDVALQLTKPVDFPLYWFSDELGRSFYYIVMRALPTFVLARILFGMSFPADLWTGLIFTLSIILAICLSASINIAVFSTVFWTLEGVGIGGFSFILSTFFSGFLVPIALWPDWLARIAYALPFDGMIHLPFSIYLGKIVGAAAFRALLKQAIWTFIFLGLGRLLIRRGFRKLVIQGG